MAHKGQSVLHPIAVTRPNKFTTNNNSKIKLQQLLHNNEPSRNTSKSRLSNLNISHSLVRSRKPKALLELRQKNSSLLHLKETGQGDSVSLGREYGEMLPKTGVYFLPDFKVTGFIALLDDLIIKFTQRHKYYLISEVKMKLKAISNVEMKRQIRKMQFRKEQELERVEAIQQEQFRDFSVAWDNYMNDYEQAAYVSVQRMRENLDLEIVQLRTQFLNKYHHFNLSKRCCHLRLQEKKCFAAKEYIKANQLRQQADELEIIEIQMHQE